MKAAIFRRYGPPDVVEIADVPKPTPNDDEVLIEIHATCVNSGDCRIRSLDVPRGFALLVRLIFGVFRPRKPILGTELAGVIEAVGNNVSNFKPGDKVFADTGTGCGAHAEYKTIRSDGAIALKPANLSLSNSAAICFGGTTAVTFLRDKAKLQKDERVLINGASGAVGCAAIQIAKYLGAHVTAVCSEANADLVTALGADATIDYGAEDFTRNGKLYDVIMDNAGTAPWERSRDSLTETGRLLYVVSDLPQMIKAPFVSKKTAKKAITATANGDAAMLDFLSELIEAGLLKPVIDRTYPFEQIAQAHAYVDTGRKKGSVVIKVIDDNA